MRTVKIGDREIGEGQPCFIIAEAGVNHNGRMDTAMKLIDAAIWAKADAVKFQSFKTERLASRRAEKAPYQRQTTDPAESQFDMLKKLELSEPQQEELAAYCAQKGILFLSTPFEDESAAFLDRIQVPAFKIGSGDLTNVPFLERIAGFKKPMIVSTGMASMGEVEQAVTAIKRAGNRGLILLHGVSNYPADPSTINLRAMLTLSKTFRVPAGLSDHTEGIEVAIGAAALGACVIEKHLTLDRKMPGPDHLASSEPKELAALVYAVRKVQSALGDGQKRPLASEVDVAAAARKSLLAARALPAGTILAEKDLIARRPGTGIPPSALPQVAGRKLKVSLGEGEALDFDMLESGQSQNQS